MSKPLLLAITGIIIINVALCGCSGAKAGNAESEPEATVVFSDEETLNGYRTQAYENTSSAKKTESISGVYYANTNSKVFHKKECTHALKIKNENLYITSDRNELVSGGYRPCKSCNP